MRSGESPQAFDGYLVCFCSSACNADQNIWRGSLLRLLASKSNNSLKMTCLGHRSGPVHTGHGLPSCPRGWPRQGTNSVPRSMAQSSALRTLGTQPIRETGEDLLVHDPAVTTTTTHAVVRASWALPWHYSTEIRRRTFLIRFALPAVVRRQLYSPAALVSYGSAFCLHNTPDDLCRCPRIIS